MLSSFKIGDLVWVKPKAGLRVQEHADIPGRFLPAEGKQLAWSHWVHDRVSDGTMLLAEAPATKPTPAPLPLTSAFRKGDE